MTDHPITPPPELVQQLCDKALLHAVDGARRGEIEVWLIQEAFRAGADQELEACCKWLPKLPPWSGEDLRKHRRPKPPSLKRVALLQLDTLNADLGLGGKGVDLSQIRRALEALPDD